MSEWYTTEWVVPENNLIKECHIFYSRNKKTLIREKDIKTFFDRIKEELGEDCTCGVLSDGDNKIISITHLESIIVAFRQPLKLS